jgi:hypothetical protein
MASRKRSGVGPDPNPVGRARGLTCAHAVLLRIFSRIGAVDVSYEIFNIAIDTRKFLSYSYFNPVNEFNESARLAFPIELLKTPEAFPT